MSTRVNVEWPVDLSENGLLDFALGVRTKGEKLALWLEETNSLAVFFDEQRGQSLEDYFLDEFAIAPGVYLIQDRRFLTSMAGAEVAGFFIESVDRSLSFFYQVQLGSRYRSFARSFNKKKEVRGIEFLWDLHTSMAFIEHAEEDYITDLRMYFEAYKDMVEARIKDIPPIHIPLNVYRRYPIA